MTLSNRHFRKQGYLPSVRLRDRNHIKVALWGALLLFLMAAISHTSQAALEEHSVDFHFIGEWEYSTPDPVVWIYNSFDITVSGTSRYEMLGWTFYSLTSIEIRGQVGYGLPPFNDCPGIREITDIRFTTDDFLLDSASSIFTYIPQGQIGNPFPENDYLAIITRLKRTKSFPTPAGAQITFDAGIPCQIASIDTTAIAVYESGIVLMAQITLPPPYRSLGFLAIGASPLSSKPGYLHFLDPDRPDNHSDGTTLYSGSAPLNSDLIGAAADGESEVIFEVTYSQRPPEVTLPVGGGAWVENSEWTLSSGKWQRLWKAPKDLKLEGDVTYNSVASRVLDIQVMADGRNIPQKRFELYKPPVLFLVGVMDRGSSMNRMAMRCASEYLDGNYYLVSSPNYPTDISFEANMGNVNEMVENLIRKCQFYGIAASKVDIVAHSMGGVLASKYAATALGRKVNRIITIDSPHSGSELANYTLHFPYEEMNPEQIYKFVMIASSAADYNLGYLPAGVPWKGATEDLQVGSGAIIRYRESLTRQKVPVYAIIGISDAKRIDFRIEMNYIGFPINFGLLYWDYEINHDKFYFDTNESYYEYNCWWAYFWAHSHEDRMSFVANTLFSTSGSISDYVVSAKSQRGGLSSDHSRVIRLQDHIAAMANTEVIATVIELLNSPKSCYAPRFVPEVLDLPSVGVIDVPGNDMAPNGYRKTDTELIAQVHGQELRITGPVNGSIFAPGDSIEVVVESELEAVDSIGILTASGNSTGLYSPPWIFRFKIDSTFSGPLPIAAFALDEIDTIGEFYWDEIEVIVRPTTDPLLLGLTDPCYAFLYPGDTSQVTVMGHYPDRIWREATVSGMGTIYHSDAPTVAEITPNGLIQAHAPGSTDILIKNGEAQTLLTVVVFGQPGIP